MHKYRPAYEKNQQLKLPFCFLVCDVCAEPLHPCGGNFIDSYSRGKPVVERCLCDTHYAELLELGVEK